ncbi:MAG: hypothetical protein Tsb002_30600 [Wenzhouxiangellaceae bacterium]
MIDKPALIDWIQQQLDRQQIWRHGHQGVLLHYRDADHDWLIKCPSGRGLRGWINRRSIRHEYRCYQRLRGIPGISPCHGLVAGRYLVIEHLHATGYRETPLQQRQQWFEQLRAAIEAMHQRGVAHGDLKRKANLLVTADGQPLIIDFGAAWLMSAGWRPLNQRLFRYLRQTDWNAYVKHKYHGRYRDVQGPDRELLRYSWLERQISRWRKWREQRRNAS